MFPSERASKINLQNNKHWKINEERVEKIFTMRKRIHEKYINEYVWDIVLDYINRAGQQFIIFKHGYPGWVDY